LQALGQFSAALAHMACIPYVPDWVAVTEELVRMAEERGLLCQVEDGQDVEVVVAHGSSPQELN